MAELSIAGCLVINPHVRIPEFSIGIIITVVNVICCIRSLYVLKHGSTAKQIKTKVKIACGLIVILFAIESILQLISSGVHIFCNNKNFHDQTRWNIYRICVGLLWLLYPVSLLSLYLLFGIKLIESFEGSIMEVSKFNKRLFYFSVALQWIFYVILETISYISFQLDGDNTVALFVILSLMLVYGLTFSMLLRLFHIQVNACAQTLFKNDSENQMNLFNMCVRQMNCCFLAITSTMINMLIYIIGICLNFNVWILGFHMIATNADFTLNSILLMFQYSVCDKEYYQFCHKCDLVCKYCFHSQTSTK